MPALFLSEADVRELLDMEVAIDVVEAAFRELGTGGAHNEPRRRVRSSGVMLHTMSASAEYLNRVGWKTYTTTKDAARFHVGLYDGTTGELLAMIEADWLGQLRTGAASGVATEYMARPDSSIVGLIGTGTQARTQLKAVCTVRRIERVEVYSRDADRRIAFAEDMSEYCGTRVVPVHSPDEAATDKDIVITATSSRTPVFDHRSIVEGTHLNVIGSNSPQKQEIDPQTVQRADNLVCDSVEQCRIEAGELLEAVNQGLTDWRLMHDLGDVVTGQKTGRAQPEHVTLFDSVGLAIEDVALATELLTRARKEGFGQPLPL